MASMRSTRSKVAALVASAMVSGALLPTTGAEAALVPAAISRVSTDTAGGPLNAPAGTSSLSLDGRYVTFSSSASDVVAGDGNGLNDVFVRDRVRGVTSRVSVDQNGGDADGVSYESDISSNGQFVAFTTNATDIVAGDANGLGDVYIRELATGVTRRLSVDSAGGDTNGESTSPSVSADGRYVSFWSTATDVVIGDTNGLPDIFVRDLVTNTTARVTLDPTGGSLDAGAAPQTSISGNGRLVAFETAATDTVANDTNAESDIFLRNLDTGVTTRVSLDILGGDSNDRSSNPAISADGRYVAFNSLASDLVTGDGNGFDDVYVRDLQTSTNRRASLDTGGGDTNGDSFTPAISGDGRIVAFHSLATDLVGGDTNGLSDVFTRDMVAGTTRRISVAPGGGNTDQSSDEARLSDDGCRAAFTSSASNLVPSDGNALADIFVTDIGAGLDGIVAVSPARLLDTRAGQPTVDGQFAGAGIVGPGATLNLRVTGRGGVADRCVGAVILNVTSTQADAASFVTVWPTGDARPNASNVNTAPGQDTPNLVVAKVGAGGQVSLYNNAGSSHLVADIVGWIPTGTTFVPQAPARLLDTRPGQTTVDGQFAGGGAVGPGGSIDLTVGGRAGLPSTGVAAVVVNVTSTESDTSSFVTVWPTGEGRPNASNLNTEPGQDTPNLVVAKVGAGGQISLYNNAGTGHLVADLVGWFTASSAFTSLTPARLLDTRAGQPTIDGQFSGAGRVGSDTINLTVAGRGGVPAVGVTSVVLNVTSSEADAPSFITVWPADEPRPNASNLNTDPGQDTPNLVVARLAPNGQVSIYNNAGTGHLIVDVVAWAP